MLEAIVAEESSGFDGGQSTFLNKQPSLNKNTSNQSATSADRRLAIKQSRRLVQYALYQFTEKLKKDLKENVNKDNRSELHKIFTVYQRLDKLDEGVQEYLNSVVR